MTKVKLSGFSIFLFLITFLLTTNLFAQQTPADKVYVDKSGIMRWSENNSEVKGFGVNYAVPFAHAYRSAKRMGIDHKEAIDNDIYHFTRLGFDLYRIHVWDTEISDTLGNLIQNEHLETFDYLLKQLKDKHIKAVITPIAFWGNGWPEPDEKTPGFSYKYGKENCLVNETAIKAQQNYLYQFLNHVNPYTGLAYKDEPNIIAFEISNEPHHRGEPEQVTAFVKGMVDAMRRTGMEKPIFYNMSHAVHFTEAYFKGGVQGGTYQWYPTNLLYSKTLSGNLLPNANHYDITYDPVVKKYKGAKMVYEFDAADVDKSYIYPAMARSFRTAGLQIATHFGYEPTFLGHINTDYSTHYMNLSYTPQKALALKICGEIFHEIPLYESFGTYPSNNSFGDFSVDYKKDLAIYNGDKKFFYTNTNKVTPKNEQNLLEIAGYGNSALVKYGGKGAYFLDKLEDGIWRLEVMPDAIIVDNPFARKNSPGKTVGVINWKEHTMKLNLEGLGNTFSVKTINDDNDYIPRVENAAFSIIPGTYLLVAIGKKIKYTAEDKFRVGQLKDFYAPAKTADKPWLKHKAIKEASANQPLHLKVQYVGPQPPTKIIVAGNLGNFWFDEEMKQVSAYQYEVTLPSGMLNPGYLKYNIVVETSEKESRTYPSGIARHLWDWDYYDTSDYTTRIVPAASPIYLFDAVHDAQNLVKKWLESAQLVPNQKSGEASYNINIEKLFSPSIENLEADPIYDYSFKHFIIDIIKGRAADLASKENIVFYGQSLNNKPCKLQIALVLDDGSAFGNIIELTPEVKDYKLLLSDLKPVRTVTLPRPYPDFLPYYLDHDITDDFDIQRIESIQFSIGPGIPPKEVNNKHGVSIVNVSLQ